MKTQLNPNIRRQGFTYLTAVATLIIIGIMLGAYLKMVAVQNQLTVRSQTWNRSIPVLEAGVEEAIAHLNKNGSPGDTGTVDLNKMVNDGWSNDGSLTGPWRKVASFDGDIYYVTISSWDGSTARFPTISATGYVRQLPAFAWKRTSGPLFAQQSLLESGIFTKRMVQCGVTNKPLFTKGIVAKHGIDMNGNDLFTDSYDSSIAAFNVNGRWDMGRHRDHGDVASNDTVTNSISIANANIWGRVATGPLGTISIGPNGSVGDYAWQTAGTKGIKPGFSTDDMNVEFQDSNPPDGSGGWVPAAGSTLTTGNYLINTVNGSLTIADNSFVSIRVDGDWRFTGHDQLTIGSNSTVLIYLNCPSADMGGNGIVNASGTPVQCQIYGSTRLTSLSMGGNNDTTAVIYAPYANIQLNGGGSGDQDFSGAMVGNTFKFNGHFRVHYDEALGKIGTWRGFTIISWNEK